MGLIVKSIFKLKAINNDIAIIQSEGTIASDSSGTNLLDNSNASADLKGKQQGEYEIETKTGMLISAKISARVEGELTIMGTEVPVKIETSVKINGRRMK